MEILSIKALTSKYTIEGMEYIGSVATVADLPTPSKKKKGNVYTIVANGHEYVCDGTQWIDLSADLANKEDISNKVTSISSESTDIQYPSAKCVYDEIDLINEEIDTKITKPIDGSTGQVLTKTAEGEAWADAFTALTNSEIDTIWGDN